MNDDDLYIIIFCDNFTSSVDVNEMSAFLST